MQLDDTQADRPEVQGVGEEQGSQVRELLRNAALRNAIRKRAVGVPTYTVPEAAALLSISQEYLYRLIQADSFPSVRMRIGANQGRYIVPAKAVETLLGHAADVGNCVDATRWTADWLSTSQGGGS